MEQRDMEQLAFIILKELKVNKSDSDLIQSIRTNRKLYLSALRSIPTEVPKAQIIDSPY